MKKKREMSQISSLCTPLFREGLHHSFENLPEPEQVHQSQHRRHRYQTIEAKRKDGFHLGIIKTEKRIRVNIFNKGLVSNYILMS